MILEIVRTFGINNRNNLNHSYLLNNLKSMHYDAEANVICWELSRDPISHAVEFGNFIIHFSKSRKPVLIEILEADKFTKQFEKIKKVKEIEEVIPVN